MKIVRSSREIYCLSGMHKIILGIVGRLTYSNYFNFQQILSAGRTRHRSHHQVLFFVPENGCGGLAQSGHAEFGNGVHALATNGPSTAVASLVVPGILGASADADDQRGGLAARRIPVFIACHWHRCGSLALLFRLLRHDEVHENTAVHRCFLWCPGFDIESTER